VDVKKVVDWEAAMHAHVRANHAEILEQINASGDYNAEIEAGLRKALDDFKATGAY
jgi:F-type H+-transporting ATPase subunit alpha